VYLEHACAEQVHEEGERDAEQTVQESQALQQKSCLQRE
jgi:hypothetical protein